MSANYNGYHEADGKGTTRHNIGPNMTWRPTSATSVSTGFRYNINNDDSQWVENEEPEGEPTRYVFGRLKQRTVAFTFRVNYTLTPELVDSDLRRAVCVGGRILKLQTAGQWPRARVRRIATRPTPTPATPISTIRSFRTTNVLRWEYKPGSSLFVVWQQGRSGDGELGDFQFGRDFGGVFRAPAHNVFLVKLSYWLNM